jgi:hypothetical protein
MKFLKTIDMVCNREILLNLQGAQITYIEKVGPKITLVHFATGGTVKIPIAMEVFQAQLIDANSPEPQMVTVNAPIETMKSEGMVSHRSAPFMIGNEETDRRKIPDRRSTSALEHPPQKPDKHDKPKKDDK